MKVVENFIARKAYGETLDYWKDIYCRYTVDLPLWGNSNVYQNICYWNKKTSFKFTFKTSTKCIVFAYFNVSNCQSVLKYMSPHLKLFKFSWQLYLQIWFHELPFCCVVVTLFGLMRLLQILEPDQLASQNLLCFGPADKSLSFSYFHTKTYVVGTQQHRLNKSTQNIC